MTKKACEGCGEVHSEIADLIFESGKEIINFAVAEAKLIDSENWKELCVLLLNQTYISLASAFLDENELIERLESDLELIKNRSQEIREFVNKMKKEKSR